MFYNCNAHIIDAYLSLINQHQVKQGSVHALSRTNQSLTSYYPDWILFCLYGVWSKYSMFVQMQALKKVWADTVWASIFSLCWSDTACGSTNATVWLRHQRWVWIIKFDSDPTLLKIKYRLIKHNRFSGIVGGVSHKIVEKNTNLIPTCFICTASLWKNTLLNAGNISRCGI